MATRARVTHNQARSTRRLRTTRAVRRAAPVAPRGLQRSPLQARILSVAAALLLTLVLVHEVSGLNNLRTRPILGSDYLRVSQFVAARHKPGEPVFVALPPPAYLALGSRDDLIFISSPLDRKRAQRYTRLTANGEYVDYWTGVHSIVSTGQLCYALLTSPSLWLIVDGSRLEADWAYQGEMAQVITGLTYIRYWTPSGAMVRRLAPIPARDPKTEALCEDAMAREGLALPPPAPKWPPATQNR